MVYIMMSLAGVGGYLSWYARQPVQPWQTLLLKQHASEQAGLAPPK